MPSEALLVHGFDVLINQAILPLLIDLASVQHALLGYVVCSRTGSVVCKPVLSSSRP